MRSMSGRVWSAAPTPPPRNATGGGVARTRRVVNATRVALEQRFTRCAAQHRWFCHRRLRRLRFLGIDSPSGARQ